MATYYVTPSGAGTGNGSFGNEWSLGYFNVTDRPTGGDTVVFTGTFTATVTPATSGTGNGDGRLTLDFTRATLDDNSSDATGLRFYYNQAFVTVLGGAFGTTLGNAGGFGVMFGNSATYEAHDITLDGFTHAGDETIGMLVGVYLPYVSNLVISNWHLDNCNGIVLGHSGSNLNHDILISNCYVRTSINTLYQTDIIQIADAWNVTIEGCYLCNRAPADQNNPSDDKRHNDIIQFTSTGNGNPYNLVIRWNWIECSAESGDGSSSWMILQAMNGGPNGEPALLCYGNVFVGTGTDGNQGINVGQGFENVGGNYYFIGNTVIRHLIPYYFPIAFAGNAGNVGNTAPAGADDTLSGISATFIVTTTPGNLLSLSIVSDNDASGTAIMGLYADTSGVSGVPGHPGALIASSAVGPLLGGNETVNTFAVPNGPVVPPGNYWVAVASDTPFDVLFHYGGSTDTYVNTAFAWTGTLPPTYPSGSYNNHDYTAWATFSVSPSTGNLDSRNNVGTADQPDFDNTAGAFFVSNSMVPIAADYNYFVSVKGVTNADTGPHGSLTADPKFTDYTNNDFSFTEASPLRGAGDPSVALIDSAMGFGIAPGSTWPGPTLVPRNPYWSIGAYEVPPLLIPTLVEAPAFKRAPASLVQRTTSFLQYLSPALRKDKFFVALAEALDPVLAEYLAKIPVNILISRIGGQPENVLDFLAVYHFGVDTYDLNLSYSQKLALVQGAIRNKVNKGTRAAIKDVVAVTFNYCDIVEWWQENPPAPHDTFKVVINDPLVDPVKVEKMVRTILKLKNVRSFFAGIFSYLSVPPGTVYVVGAVDLYDYDVLPYAPRYL
jgi:phage tail P2-like protein